MGGTPSGILGIWPSAVSDFGVRRDCNVYDRRSDACGQSFHCLVEREQRADAVVVERRRRGRCNWSLGEGRLGEFVGDEDNASAIATTGKIRRRVRRVLLTHALLTSFSFVVFRLLYFDFQMCN